MSDFKAKMYQIQFRLGLRPRPRWGSLQRSPRPPSCIKGTSTSKGRGGEGTRPHHFTPLSHISGYTPGINRFDVRSEIIFVRCRESELSTFYRNFAQDALSSRRADCQHFAVNVNVSTRSRDRKWNSCRRK